MVRFFCDYCDAFLTHDSPAVRKQHNTGYKHKSNVKAYYLQFEEAGMAELQRGGLGAPPSGFMPPPYMAGPPRPGMMPPPYMGGPPRGMMPPPRGMAPPFMGGPPRPGMGGPPPPYMAGPPRPGMGPPPGGAAPPPGGRPFYGAPPS